MRVLIASLTLLLAACGFQPMYSPGGGSAIGPVQIDEIEGKAGHVLRTELSRILAVENGASPSQLEITLSEQVTPLGIRIDESATRAELRLIANYVLTPPGQGAQVMRGSVVTVVNYDVPTAAFGEIAAQDDARERAAETMAQRFRSELALRMSQAREAGAAR
ncbi:LPS assembly lipoprotein LptE [Terricaulis sp.]|jgi:LPS-assembly lipoprotein|uniref:LPS assembly lipoprotein LptE n=1 Tax=Terricaulis sp. TaxID=2768686 RepID=UPI002AC4282F|nr:LPS assembly lipoprotein LptE [Terricaulis sp.]MDZ4691087.1 LPS assembly lipoprotein LptE [Terricaulis sp.]